MKAMILAAGYGRRLLPLTKNTPKALIKVESKPLIVWQIERLVKAGFGQIVINLSHHHQQIIDYLKDGSEFDCEIRYSVEKEPLETLGGICQALDLLGNEFIVVNADIYTHFDYSRLNSSNQTNQKSSAHLVLVDSYNNDFLIDEKGMCQNVSSNMISKNTSQEGNPSNYSKEYTFAGIAYYKKIFFNSYLSIRKNISSSQVKKAPLAPYLFEQVDSGDKGLVSAEVYDGLWFDVGTIQRLRKLEKFLVN